MSQQLIDHSPDLKQLRDEGYEIEVKSGYLIVHYIPYVNSNREVKFGKLISPLSLNNDVTIRPDNHVINFMGECPCNKDGSIITAIQHSGQLNQPLFDGIEINFSFSNKPANGYNNYYDKVTRYAEIISAQARSIDKTATAKTFKVIVDNEVETVFNYIDSNSSRANIFQFNSKFKGQRIAIIGLGGTGAYVLDLIAKTPVQEIHLYDGDEFLQHNAFRSPGAASIEDLNKKNPKTQYYADIYSKMHKNVFSHNCYVDESNINDLNIMSYVFIAIDKDSIKRSIIEHLLKLDIPFIDVGLGVNIVDDSLIGTLRVTTGTQLKNDHIYNRISCGDDINNEYSTNIQIADLNAMNAILAIIKWKKLSGFYQDLKKEHNSSYSINVSQLINDDFAI